MSQSPASEADRVHSVAFDLLMAVMDSVSIWSAAAGDEGLGLAWRDAVTRRMAASQSYVPFEDLVGDAAADLRLPHDAVPELFERWREMDPWPDSRALSRLRLPYGFVTNCSAPLARLAADRSGLTPRFVLSAEEAGCYKPDARIYREACRRLRAPPRSTLFVAGSAYDSEGAHAAGLQAALVARRAGDRAPDGGVRVAASLEEIVAGLEPSPPTALDDPSAAAERIDERSSPS